MDQEKKEQGKLAPKPNEEMLGHEEHKEIAGHEKLKELPSSDRLNEIEEQLKRLQAEFENYKKRSGKEREEFATNAGASMVKRLLPVLEEFELAVSHAKAKHNEDEVVKGFGMVFSNLKLLLEKEGLREMNCEGESFDPYKHEAVRSEESDVEERRIIGVVRKGYFFKDRVLQHASVIVSKGKERGCGPNECDVCG